MAWGITTMCLGFIRNYAGFVAVRAVLGATEGGLLPGIVSFGSLVTFYRHRTDGPPQGLVLVRHVYTRRNGCENWTVLYQRVFIWFLWRFVPVMLSLPI